MNAPAPPILSLEEFERVSAPLLRPPFRSRFGRVRWRDLDAPGPEYDYVIDGILTAHEKSVIGGPSKSGKSFLAIHAAMSIARGTPFFDKTIRRPGLVVYQAGEGARGIKKRLRAYRKHHNVPKDADIPFELLTSKVDLYRPDGDTGPLIEEIHAIAADYPDLPLAAIFIDTLATAQGGADENSGRDMGTVMGNIDKLREATGAHVCLVHHMNSGGTKLRGHTSIYANVDNILLVTSQEGVREDGARWKISTAMLDKQKDDEDGIAIRFELLKVPIGTRDDGAEISSCICLPVGEKAELKAQSNKAFRPSDTERLFLRAVITALSERGVPPPRHLGLPRSIRSVVDYLYVKQAFQATFPGDEDDPKKLIERIKKALQRARTTLQNYEIVGADKPYIWLTGKPVMGMTTASPKPPDLAEIEKIAGEANPDIDISDHTDLDMDAGALLAALDPEAPPS